MDLNLLNSELTKENLLSKIIYFDELESTNKYAKENNITDDTLIITSHQTNGTGRFGRIWKSVPGKNLTFTIVKSFKIGIDEIHLVNFYSSYILCETLKNLTSNNNSITDFEVTLKWPNDIILNRKKVAGFLLDVRDLKKELKKFIIGIGINVNQEAFHEDINLKATSLLLEFKTEVNPEELLILFIKNFYDRLFLLNNKNVLMKYWNENSNIEGKKIRFKKVEDDTEQDATVICIDDDGGLKMKLNDDKVKKYYSGEISLIY